MASIFTYDPNPPRVSSPWLTAEEPGSNASLTPSPSPSAPNLGRLLSDYSVTKLRPEPQEGPTEYKLHLLLRPRRAYDSMSTDAQSAGHRKARLASPGPSASTVPDTSQPRQDRLKHLTTQLLWRMQQSSPYHTAKSKELVVPRLPSADIELDAPIRPGELAPGLEESRGALYEIGVTDDGTLVGLTKDEMDESISTLRVMAASLGCSVEVSRMVIVGECEWTESTELVDSAVGTPVSITKQGKLWVAEAFVLPGFGGRSSFRDIQETADLQQTNIGTSETSQLASIPSCGSSVTPQLRVTFTGPTTSGKSSLLGTLTTGTLDNGRGKSRLSLLKHRHEVVSGVTSSIAQELIGYRDHCIENFSQSNIEVWTDIHDFSQGGRLVFVSDSGGHPRYRRTVLRGLMNWAPHWSILCVASDDTETAPGSFGATPTAQDFLGAGAAGIDLVKAHLTLSLKLEAPLVIVITKLDLASKASLQKTMGKVLTAIKDARRTPKIIQPDQRQHEQLKEIPVEDIEKISGLIDNISSAGSLTKIVPIVLTSAVNGKGIGLVHALLESLPLPPPPTSRDFVGLALNPEQPKCLFHVDDTFSLPASYGALAADGGLSVDEGVVVSGHLRFGSMSVGDSIVVGPFPAEDDEARGLAPDDRPSPGSYGLSISHPSSAELARIAMKNAVSASTIAGEWHKARIVSIRNLRLPVRTLEAGQGGSLGLVFQPASIDKDEVASNPPMPRIRRGMVLATPSDHMLETGLSLQAASGFTATFRDPSAEALTVGSFVNVYVASFRAAARVLAISHHLYDEASGRTATEDLDDIFSLNEEMEGDGTKYPGERPAEKEVVLELLHNREWIELGSRVILLEGGNQDRSGLEGIVGKVIEIVD